MLTSVAAQNLIGNLPSGHRDCDHAYCLIIVKLNEIENKMDSIYNQTLNSFKGIPLTKWKARAR